MKLWTIFLLLLPLACVSFSPPRRPKEHDSEISGIEESSLEDVELNDNTTDTDVTGQQGQVQRKERPVVMRIGRRWRRKNKRPNKVTCKNGGKSKKCKRWARKQARRQRRIRKRLDAAVTRMRLGQTPKLSAASPPLAQFCRKLNRRGIEDAAIQCAEINNVDVDTFMDFVLLIFSNSSLQDLEEAYPEDEQEQLENILSCLGNRKRWHRTNDLDEVLAELRTKKTFYSIQPCVEEIGRNCSWNEEGASGWLHCVELLCRGIRIQNRLRSRWPQFANIATDSPSTSTVEPPEDNDFNSILTEEIPYDNEDNFNDGSKEEYEWDYSSEDEPDVELYLEKENDYEEMERNEDYRDWAGPNQQIV